MPKRLWQILGPLVCAAGLLLILLIAVPSGMKENLEAEKIDAVALTDTSFKSRYKKNRALGDSKHRFVPFFGSSEWLRFDSMHPSVLAEAYQRDYTPYLLGQRGAASLTQYFGMQQIEEVLQAKQAVYVISPQWFTAQGANEAAFQKYFTTDQLVAFLQQEQQDVYAQYAAQRFLELKPNSSLTTMLQKVIRGQALSDSDRLQLQWQGYFLEKQDALFSQLEVKKANLDRVYRKASGLPEEFSYEALGKVAWNEANLATRSNDFRIDDHFYKTRLQGRLKKLKGSQSKISYLQSPEYNDFQLVLGEFAKQNTDVLFVIPPVNERWMAYTGLSAEMYQQTVAKIKYQLTSQGFDQIADLSQEGGEEYFMQDTIHIGWNGWLTLDRYINPFLTEERPPVSYHLNSQFLTSEWARYKGEPSQFLAQ